MHKTCFKKTDAELISFTFALAKQHRGKHKESLP